MLSNNNECSYHNYITMPYSLFSKGLRRTVLNGMLLFLVHTALAQNTAFDEMRKIPITSPDVASLAKAVEFPVTLFNGRPDISIPIYAIKTGDIELPITLAYNAGGIPVSEEASWVGLGWVLNAGGVISRQIKGMDDDYNISSSRIGQYFPDVSGNMYQAEAAPLNFVPYSHGVFKANGQLYTLQELFSAMSGDVDGEPDLLVYNFGKYTGKFIWLSNTTILDISNNNIKFEKSAGGIIATDPEGFKYEFMTIELTMTMYGPTKTAYFLSKITSPTNHTLTLNYKPFREYVLPAGGPGLYNDYINLSIAVDNGGYVTQLPTLSEEYIQYEEILRPVNIPLPTVSGLVRNFSGSSIRTLFLESINFENGTVTFTPGSRKDLYNVRLDKISVTNKAGNTVSEAMFNYDYFIARTGNESYTVPAGSKPTYDESYRRKRLKLNSVTINGEQYKYYYNEGSDGYTLPYKSSFEQDYWGYYNGAYANMTLVPDFKRYNLLSAIPNQLRGWVGANRDPVFAKAVEGTLKKVMYPTKGLAEFEYGLHEFNNVPGQTFVSYNTTGALNTTAGTTTNTFTITADTYADVAVSLFCNSAADANPTGTGWDCGCVFPPDCNASSIQNSMWVEIEKINPVTGQASPTRWQYDFGKAIIRENRGDFILKNEFFTAGTYRLTANYPDNKIGAVGQRMASISVSVPIFIPNDPIGKGGGLRIVSSSKYDPVTKISSKKLYTYDPGVMMRPPDYYSVTDHVPGSISGYNWYRTHTLYANPRTPFSFSANGSHVGYGKVKEYYTGQALGTTEYLYTVKQDKYPFINLLDNSYFDYIAGTPSIPYLDNGFLKTINYYNKDYQLVKTVSNTARIEQTKTYWAFKTHKIAGVPLWNVDLPKTLLFTFYPIQVGKLLPATTSETIFDLTNNSGVSITREFEYTDRTYLKSEKQTGSDGLPVTKHFRYPTDFTATTGWIGELKNRNMISQPIEMVTKVNDKLVDGTFKTYALHDNILTPAEIYTAEILSPAAVNFIAPSGTLPTEYKLSGLLDYDATGNLNYSKSNNNIPIGYKWGYNKIYPVAICKNAVPSQFYYEDFEGNGTLASNTTTAHTGKGGYNGTINLATQFGATTAGRTYKLSYFKFNGSSWAYTDEPYTGQSVSGILDDIRIYPQDGEITSYTYTPLVGLTSIIQPTGNTTYYNYDSYNRLTDIRDQDRLVLKSFSYYYSPTLGTDNSVTYGNVVITRNFYKECTVGEGSLVPYTVPANKYTAGSPEEANAMAQAEIEQQGQLNANNTGVCDVGLKITSIVNGAGNSFTVNFTCPASVNQALLLFAKDPVTGRPYNDRPFTVPLGTSSFTGTITKGASYVFNLLGNGSNIPGGVTSANVSFTFP